MTRSSRQSAQIPTATVCSDSLQQLPAPIPYSNCLQIFPTPISCNDSLLLYYSLPYCSFALDSDGKINYLQNITVAAFDSFVRNSNELNPIVSKKWLSMRPTNFDRSISRSAQKFLVLVVQGYNTESSAPCSLSP